MHAPSFLTCFVMLTFFAYSVRAEPMELVDRARQMIVVTTTDWSDKSGKLALLERKENKWKEIAQWKVVVGRNGLAWGKGIHPAENGKPQKREGDGKSPAGIFTLSSAFGSETSTLVKQIKLPYLQLSSLIECVDDSKSAYYNTIVDRNSVQAPDWSSSEKMLAIGEQYRLGVVVDHNSSPRKPGDGSCIFLHIWKDAGTGTAGCTAMEGPHMETLVRWVDPEKFPLMVQLPTAEYDRYQTRWKLPSLRK